MPHNSQIEPNSERYTIGCGGLPGEYKNARVTVQNNIHTSKHKWISDCNTPDSVSLANNEENEIPIIKLTLFEISVEYSIPFHDHVKSYVVSLSLSYSVSWNNVSVYFHSSNITFTSGANWMRVNKTKPTWRNCQRQEEAKEETIPKWCNVNAAHSEKQTNWWNYTIKPPSQFATDLYGCSSFSWFHYKEAITSAKNCEISTVSLYIIFHFFVLYNFVILNEARKWIVGNWQ